MTDEGAWSEVLASLEIEDSAAPRFARAPLS